MIYNQGDTFYPATHVESGSFIAAVDWGLLRLSDGFFLDFNDSTFKSTGWTTQYQSLTDASPFWQDTTGITLPSANGQYQVIYREDSTDYTQGDKFQIRDDLLIGTVTTNTDMRGTDGANTTVPDAAGTAPTAIEIRTEIDSNSTQLAAIVLDTAELQVDWTNGGRLDLIIDAILQDTSTTLDTKINDIQGVTFDTTTDSIEAIRNRGDAAWTGGGSAPTVNDIWAKVIETAGSITAQQALSVILSESAGELVAASSTFKTPDGSATRIAGTADSSGNRSAITLTPSA